MLTPYIYKPPEILDLAAPIGFGFEAAGGSVAEVFAPVFILNSPKPFARSSPSAAGVGAGAGASTGFGATALEDRSPPVHHII